VTLAGEARPHLNLGDAAVLVIPDHRSGGVVGDPGSALRIEREMMRPLDFEGCLGESPVVGVENRELFGVPG
jgi:hypothetical protein